MPQGSHGRVARLVAGAAGPVAGAVGWTIDRALAAGEAFASRSRPEVTSSCATEALTRPTASIAGFGLPCATGVTSTVQGAWYHVLEAEASEAEARAERRAERRAQQRRADQKERREKARKAAKRKAAERRAEQREKARKVAKRKAAERRAEQREKTRKAAKRQAEQARRKAGASRSGWRNAPIVTWYGPGFYGNRTACGVRYTRRIVGVAHRTLPCGTLVEFKWHGITAVAPVIDRGPFASKAYVFDFSAALSCDVFKPRKIDNACFTRYDVKYRVVGRVPLKSYLRRQ